MESSKGGGQREDGARVAARDFYYLTSISAWEQLESRKSPAKCGTARSAATIINGMKPETVGRTLGIGLRVAGRIAGQHMAARAQAAPAAPQPVVEAAVRNRAAGQAAGQASRGVARGVGGFLRPFRRVGGILWLEVSGVFFLIFVPVFISRGLWPMRASYLHGPDHWKFLAYVGLTLGFLYLGVSSFWRAHKR
jgi:hypothetical protein